MESSKIRQVFLDFFKEKGHVIVPSAPLVIKNDPTLMFTNAGMNQFKDYFLGNAKPQHPRVADTQKCLRVSGKHNDLEDVGIDTYHHTMFEMLGNWSFGNYFKKEAIAWSWELLTERYSLRKEDIYATVFGGDEKEGLDRDLESFELWKQYLPEERILFGSKKDNFWEMGEQGPCGPCTELHYDMRPANERVIPGRELVNNDHPQVIEIWNNVFMEFNRLASGELTPLPAKHVDTGMGFERLCRAVQGKQSNYDSDVFTPLLDTIAAISGKTYGQDEKIDIAFRVIADHCRAVSFAIADGQLPSNNKAGYVIRRILRRAVRYGYSFLGVRTPFIYKLVDVLAGQFGHVFPEIVAQHEFIARTIQEEERSFLRTLETGIVRFEGYADALAGNVVEGAVAFELYDTFGFPQDLTSLLARERGLTLDETGFDKAMEEQRARSRNSAATSYGDWQEVHADKAYTFIGYDALQAAAAVIKFRTVEAKGEIKTQAVISPNPFYAESGGQVGDTGTLTLSQGESSLVLEVENTIKENDLAILILPEEAAVALANGTVWLAQVDVRRRGNISANHTATHLYHAALRQVLGHHVQQKGSLVGPDELRFDFSHPAKVSADELAQVAAIVAEKIREAIPLKEDRFVPQKQAVEKGAMALFGEKYGDLVRVITFDSTFSVELCGGTHVSDTGKIGLAKIIGESSVSAGVRRITALTGEGAITHYEEALASNERVRAALNTTHGLSEAIQKIKDENQALKEQLKSFERQALSQLIETVRKEAKSMDGITLYAYKAQLSAEDAKTLVFEVGKADPSSVVVFASEYDGKPLLSAYLGTEAQKKEGLDARQLTKAGAAHIQGGGGGQPFYATAGGKNAAGLAAALDAALAELSRVLA